MTSILDRPTFQICQKSLNSLLSQTIQTQNNKIAGIRFGNNIQTWKTKSGGRRPLPPRDNRDSHHVGSVLTHSSAFS